MQEKEAVRRHDYSPTKQLPEQLPFFSPAAQVYLVSEPCPIARPRLQEWNCLISHQIPLAGTAPFGERARVVSWYESGHYPDKNRLDYFWLILHVVQ